MSIRMISVLFLVFCLGLQSLVAKAAIEPVTATEHCEDETKPEPEVSEYLGLLISFTSAPLSSLDSESQFLLNNYELNQNLTFRSKHLLTYNLALPPPQF